MLKSLKTCPIEANLIALMSLVILGIKVIFLNSIPASSRLIYDFGVVFDAILISVLASFIFYFFVVHLKAVSDRKTIWPYVGRHSNSITGSCLGQLSEISKASGVALTLKNLNVEDVSLAFAKIHPYSEAPLRIGYPGVAANWIQYFEYHNRRSRVAIGRVLGQLIYLEPKHVSLINAIDDCVHFMVIDSFGSHQVSNTDLTAWSSSFYDYCICCRELDDYLKKFD